MIEPVFICNSSGLFIGEFGEYYKRITKRQRKGTR